MPRSFLYLVISIFAFTFCTVTNLIAQGSQVDLSKYFATLENFNSIANRPSETMVFKLLQFNAPFRGGYHETYLDRNGQSYSERVSEFARQATRGARLTEEQVTVVKLKLAGLISPNSIQKVEPADGLLYSALVFNDGQRTIRSDFIGQIPGQLQEIINFLNTEYDKAEKKWVGERRKRDELLKAKYGDWQHKEGVLTPATSSNSPLKSVLYDRIQLMALRGVKGPFTGDRTNEVPVYYAVIIYPEGRVSRFLGAGTGGADPVSNSGIVWTMANNSDRPDEQLDIENNAINGTINIRHAVYKLNKGNLFVIRMDKNWIPNITQLNIHLDVPTDYQKILSIFRKELKDESLDFPK